MIISKFSKEGSLKLIEEDRKKNIERTGKGGGFGLYNKTTLLHQNHINKYGLWEYKNLLENNQHYIVCKHIYNKFREM